MYFGRVLDEHCYAELLSCHQYEKNAPENFSLLLEVNEIVINVWVLLSILMDLGLVLAVMQSWSLVNYCGGNALTGESAAYLFFSFFIVRYLSMRRFSSLFYISDCDRLLRAGWRPQDFYNIFSNKFFIWGWGFCQKILVKKDMEELHFLYQFKNNP